jgi:hypothetical protein
METAQDCALPAQAKLVAIRQRIAKQESLALQIKHILIMHFTHPQLPRNQTRQQGVAQGG